MNIERMRKEIELAIRHETNTDDPTDEYASLCYNDAREVMEAIIPILEKQGHSGMSYNITTGIIKRLIDGKPLTGIGVDESEWVKSQYNCTPKITRYQNKRLPSFWKEVELGAKPTYSDSDRVIVYYNGKDIGWGNGYATDLIDELFPINPPYMPADKRFKVYAEEVEESKDVIKAKAYLYCIDPEGKKHQINRFVDGDYNEISKRKYNSIKAKYETKGE